MKSSRSPVVRYRRLQALQHLRVKHSITANRGWAGMARFAEVIRERAARFFYKKSSCGQIVRLDPDRVDCDIHRTFGDETVLPEIANPS